MFQDQAEIAKPIRKPADVSYGVDVRPIGLLIEVISIYWLECNHWLQRYLAVPLNVIPKANDETGRMYGYILTSM
jgi:hypothetical protein